MVYRLQVPGPIEEVVEVRLLQWHKSVGDTVSAQELLVEVETSKALIELRAAQAGVLRTLVVPEGEWAKVGGTLGLLSDAADEGVPEANDSLPVFQTAFDVA